MNSFQLNGYMRDQPEEMMFQNGKVMAFNLTQDNGKLNVPIYLTTPTLINYVTKKCVIGCELEVQGRIATQRYIRDSKVFNRPFFIAEKIKRTNLPKVSFGKNVIMSKLLDVYDPDDLLKNYRKADKRLKEKKIQEEESDEHS